MAEAMFSEDGEVDGARLDAHVSEVDAFVSAASKTTRLGLRIALLLVRLSPLLLFFRLSTMERLCIADRVTLLSRLERSTRSNLSLAFIGWRTIMTLVFYEDETELHELGYGHARERYKRALPMAATATPVPVESGVRLRDSDTPSVQERTADGESLGSAAANIPRNGTSGDSDPSLRANRQRRQGRSSSELDDTQEVA